MNPDFVRLYVMNWRIAALRFQHEASMTLACEEQLHAPAQPNLTLLLCSRTCPRVWPHTYVGGRWPCPMWSSPSSMMSHPGALVTLALVTGAAYPSKARSQTSSPSLSPCSPGLGKHALQTPCILASEVPECISQQCNPKWDEGNDRPSIQHAAGVSADICDRTGRTGTITSRISAPYSMRGPITTAPDACIHS